MTYTLTPGNIASILTVTDSNGVEHVMIYMADGKPVQVGIHNTPAFESFPVIVRAEVNRHFGCVFALPPQYRGDYLKNCVPWHVTAE